MRIKYRALHKVEKKMYQVVDIYFGKSGEIQTVRLLAEQNGMKYPTNDIFINEVVLMQYTGMNDKNDKEIYEEDIIRLDDDYDIFGSLSGEKMKVTFNEGCFVLQNNYNPKAFHTFGDSLEHIEAIGNIYENPELMEK